MPRLRTCWTAHASGVSRDTGHLHLTNVELDDEQHVEPFSLKRDRTASVAIRAHRFIQNLRRGHYELGVDALPGVTIAAAFDDLALVV